MVDDIDDLLDEVESKFCRESPSNGKAPINSKSVQCKTKTINRWVSMHILHHLLHYVTFIIQIGGWKVAHEISHTISVEYCIWIAELLAVSDCNPVILEKNNWKW